MAAYSDLQASVDYVRGLAEKKLGAAARIICRREGWVAECDTPSGQSRITATNLPTLTWLLEQLGDLPEQRS